MKNEYDQILNKLKNECANGKYNILCPEEKETLYSESQMNSGELFLIVGFLVLSIVSILYISSIIDKVFQIMEKIVFPFFKNKMFLYSLLWGVFVLLFVFFFEPYGSRMNDEEIKHAIGAMFLPPVFISLVYLIWKRT